MNTMLEKVGKDSSLMMTDLMQQTRKVRQHVCECRGMGWRSVLSMYVSLMRSYRQQDSNFLVSSPCRSNTVISMNIQVIISSMHLFISLPASLLLKYMNEVQSCTDVDR